MSTRAKVLTWEQRALIEGYGEHSTAEQIWGLHLEKLAGIGCRTIRETLREAGLIDLERSRWLTGAQRIPQEKRVELAEFLQNGGRQLSDRVVAEKFGINEAVVFRLRVKTIGKVGYTKKRTTVEMERLRRRKIVQYHVARRRKLFYKLLLLRIKLFSEPGTIHKTCNVCRREWPKTPDFFPMYGRACWGVCKFCTPEIARLKRLGLYNEKSLRAVANFSWIHARRDIDYDLLHRRMLDDTSNHCWDPIMECNRCHRRWHRNKNYFHAIRDGTGHSNLLDVCLACTA